MTARRILVAGSSGSGKTTLAGRVAALLDVPHTEIDGMYWRAGWTASETFEADVAALVAQDAWITELQYRQVLPVLAARAELLVWMDLPRLQVLARVVRRTVRRRLRRELMWGVNVEPPFRTFFTDPDHIVRYSWRMRPDVEARVRAVLDLNPAVRVVRLRSQRDVDRFVRRLAAG